MNASADEKIRLIVRGDDMGMSYGSLVAFERLMNRGVMTCASVQAAGPWFEGAAEICRRNPQWCVGMHLTLIGEWRGNPWRPVLPWREVSSLVDENGYFFRYPDQLWANDPKPAELEAELRAQIELGRRMGLDPAYVDTHYLSTVKHTEVYPTIFECLRKVAAECGLPVSGLGDEKRVSSLVGQEGIAFIDNLPVEQMMSATIDMLERLTPGTWLWALHPGIDSPEQHALIHTRAEDTVIQDGIGARRAMLTEVVSSREVRSVMLNRGIELTDYRRLAENRSYPPNPIVLP